MKIFRDLPWVQTQSSPTCFYLLVKTKSIKKRRAAVIRREGEVHFLGLALT